MSLAAAFSPAEIWGRVSSAALDSPLHIKTLPCACGGWITANVEAPGPEVLRHNQAIKHRAWWARVRRDWQGEEPLP